MPCCPVCVGGKGSDTSVKGVAFDDTLALGGRDVSGVGGHTRAGGTFYNAWQRNQQRMKSVCFAIGEVMFSNVITVPKTVFGMWLSICLF